MTLERAFADGPAFVPYVVAGDPDRAATERYVEALVAGGADAVELGLPFSEPIAEGPTIQQGIARALSAGMTPDRYFRLVEDLAVDVPLVTMTYYNLIVRYDGPDAGDSGDRGDPDASDPGDAERASDPDDPGADGVGDPGPFVARAAAAGIEGLIVPDLPVEEAGPLRAACDRHGLDLVMIVAPTTTGDRLDRLLAYSSGYLYVQARLGTTGAREDVSGRTAESLARLSDCPLPKAVGFGISEGAHAREVVAAGADGVIVGSAIVDRIAAGHEGDRSRAAVAADLESFARELKDGARAGARDRSADADDSGDPGDAADPADRKRETDRNPQVRGGPTHDP